MILLSSPYLCRTEDPSGREREKHDQISEQQKNLQNLKVLEVMRSYWVVLLVCGVMHSPPVRGPFPRISHHVIQTVSIGREGHHLHSGENNATNSRWFTNTDHLVSIWIKSPNKLLKWLLRYYNQQSINIPVFFSLGDQKKIIFLQQHTPLKNLSAYIHDWCF